MYGIVCFDKEYGGVMEYICSFCGLTATDIEKVKMCEAKGSSSRFAIGDEVVFWSRTYIPSVPRRTSGIQLRGEIAGVVHELLTHTVTYRIFVGDYPILRHRNCIYGGIEEQQVLYKVQCDRVARNV